nr:MAG TPA: hypothetical protein [Caudoviricetes sp.]
MRFHAEATPDGVNIMIRNDVGMYEHVTLITNENGCPEMPAAH